MSTEKSWLDALKETLEEEEARPPREDPGKPTLATVPKVQKPCEVSWGDVADLDTLRAARDPDERRLLAAGWSPKDRCGPLKLTIWADPETGFYRSREIALHRLSQGTEGGA